MSEAVGSATEIRTPVPALRGLCPGPLDDGAMDTCLSSSTPGLSLVPNLGPHLRLVPNEAPRLNRSLLFTAFNAAMGLARKGILDAGRVRRGLALAQSRSFDPAKYHTTGSTCWCPDFDPRKGNHSCKHQLAASFREMAGVS